MSQHQAFLDAICETPEDDTPRLVYSDWLEDQGGAANLDRAEFIRLQCRLAQMAPWDEGWAALDIRGRELERHHPEWLGWLSPFVRRKFQFCGTPTEVFRRGFPFAVRMKPAEFMQHHDALFDTTPVRAVEFRLEKAFPHKLTRLPGIRRLRAIRFSQLTEPTAPRAVKCLTGMPSLEHFGLLGSRLKEQDALALLGSPAVSEARSLWLMGTTLGVAAEEAFAAAPWPNLTELKRVGFLDLRWLGANWVRQLTGLTLSDTTEQYDPAQCLALAEVLSETAIRKLRLGCWSLDEKGARALGQAVAQSRVRSLALPTTHLGREEALALLAPQTLARLRALFTSWASLDAECVRRLAGTGLRMCGLDHINADSFAVLAEGPGLPELADLRLGITVAGPNDPFPERLREVLDSGKLPRLLSLMLCDTTPRVGARETRIGDRLAEAVARSPGSAGLQALHLEPVKRAGAEALAASPYLSGLRLLDVRVWPRDTAVEALLAERFGRALSMEIVALEF